MGGVLWGNNVLLRGKCLHVLEYIIVLCVVIRFCPTSRIVSLRISAASKGWFTRATQTQTQAQAQAQANRRVNYQDANANASTSADARNGKFFISLRLRLHFLRVNRINANANASARRKILVRERSERSCSFQQKRL